ncbi:hypothetical protein HDU67_008127 [Dinochytrium kinnereticum]|nr:hypothetical protein HDU67_008127 [Dinochytrium kinnereticum]
MIGDLLHAVSSTTSSSSSSPAVASPARIATTNNSYNAPSSPDASLKPLQQLRQEEAALGAMVKDLENRMRTELHARNQAAARLTASSKGQRREAVLRDIDDANARLESLSTQSFDVQTRYREASERLRAAEKSSTPSPHRLHDRSVSNSATFDVARRRRGLRSSISVDRLNMDFGDALVEMKRGEGVEDGEMMSGGQQKLRRRKYLSMQHLGGVVASGGGVVGESGSGRESSSPTRNVKPPSLAMLFKGHFGSSSPSSLPTVMSTQNEGKDRALTPSSPRSVATDGRLSPPLAQLSSLPKSLSPSLTVDVGEPVGVHWLRGETTVEEATASKQEEDEEEEVMHGGTLALGRTRPKPPRKDRGALSGAFSFESSVPSNDNDATEFLKESSSSGSLVSPDYNGGSKEGSLETLQVVASSDGTFVREIRHDDENTLKTATSGNAITLSVTDATMSPLYDGTKVNSHLQSLLEERNYQILDMQLRLQSFENQLPHPQTNLTPNHSQPQLAHLTTLLFEKQKELTNFEEKRKITEQLLVSTRLRLAEAEKRSGLLEEQVEALLIGGSGAGKENGAGGGTWKIRRNHTGRGLGVMLQSFKNGGGAGASEIGAPVLEDIRRVARDRVRLEFLEGRVIDLTTENDTLTSTVQTLRDSLLHAHLAAYIHPSPPNPPPKTHSIEIQTTLTELNRSNQRNGFENDETAASLLMDQVVSLTASLTSAKRQRDDLEKRVLEAHERREGVERERDERAIEVLELRREVMEEKKRVEEVLKGMVRLEEEMERRDGEVDRVLEEVEREVEELKREKEIVEATVEAERREKREDLERRLDAARSIVEELKKSKGEAEATLENERGEKVALECRIVTLQRSNVQFERGLRESTSQCEDLERQLQTLRRERKEAETMVEAERSAKTELAAQIEALRRSALEADQKFQEHAANVLGLVALHESEVEALRIELEEGQENVNELECQQKALAMDLADERQGLLRRVSEAEARRMALESELAEMARRLNEGEESRMDVLRTSSVRIVKAEKETSVLWRRLEEAEAGRRVAEEDACQVGERVAHLMDRNIELVQKIADLEDEVARLRKASLTTVPTPTSATPNQRSSWF